MSFLNVNVDSGKDQHHRKNSSDEHHLLSNARFLHFLDTALIHQIATIQGTLKVELYFTTKYDWRAWVFVSAAKHELCHEFDVAIDALLFQVVTAIVV